MADETTTTWTDLLREAKGPLVEALRFKTVLLSEVRRDKSPINWHGLRVTVPIYLTMQQGTHGLTETGTVAVPVAVETEQAFINSATLAVPVSFSPQLMRQSSGEENSWASVLPSKMRRAEDAFGRTANEQMVDSDLALVLDPGVGLELASQGVFHLSAGVVRPDCHDVSLVSHVCLHRHARRRRQAR